MVNACLRVIVILQLFPPKRLPWQTWHLGAADKCWGTMVRGRVLFMWGSASSVDLPLGQIEITPASDP